MSLKEGGHHSNVNVLRVCRSSDCSIYLLSMDESGYIRCWDARSPSTYWDYPRHQEAITAASICSLSASEMADDDVEALSMEEDIECVPIGGALNVLCTVSRDCTLRGYAVPSGRILFHIRDSGHSLRSIDCRNGYVVTAGKDGYVRCYKLFSNDIEYRFERPKVEWE